MTSAARRHLLLLVLFLSPWTPLRAAPSYTTTAVNTLARCTAHAGPEVCTVVKVHNRLCGSRRRDPSNPSKPATRPGNRVTARYVGSVRRGRAEERLLAGGTGCPVRGWTAGCLRFYYNFQQVGVIDLSVSVQYEGSEVRRAAAAAAAAAAPLWTVSSSSVDLDAAQVPVRTRNGRSFQIVFKAQRRLPLPSGTSAEASGAVYIDRIRYKYRADASCTLHPPRARPAPPLRKSAATRASNGSAKTTKRPPGRAAVAVASATSRKAVATATTPPPAEVMNDAEAKTTTTPSVTVTSGDEDVVDKGSSARAPPGLAFVAVDVLILVVVVIIAVEGFVLIRRKSSRPEREEDEDVDDDDAVQLIAFRNDSYSVQGRGRSTDGLYHVDGSQRTAHLQNIANDNLETSASTLPLSSD